MKHTPPTSPSSSRHLIRTACLSVACAMLATLWAVSGALIIGGCAWTTNTTPASGHSGATTLPLKTPSSQAATDPTDNLILVRMDTQEQDQAGFADWERLIAAKFPDGAVVIVGHGNEALGEWAIFPTPGVNPFDLPFAGCPLPEEWLCKCIRHDYGPDLPIVILSCNPGHDLITDVPNVYQATDSIWITPDADTDPVSLYLRHLLDPKIVGSLAQFQCYFRGYK